MEKRFCKYCHKDISKTEYRNIYCNSKCYMKHRGSREKGDKNPNWNGGKITLMCGFCNKPFQIVPAIKELRKHCSYRCAWNATRKYRIGEKHPFWKGGKPECIKCGKKLSHYLNATGYCFECIDISQFVPTGENSPHWKDGVEKKLIHPRGRFYRMIRNSVLKRDEYTCQLCGSKKDLQVDHIQPWAEYVELRFKMENCRTLCKFCHYEVTYGRSIPDKKIKRVNNMKGVIYV